MILLPAAVQTAAALASHSCTFSILFGNKTRRQKAVTQMAGKLKIYFCTAELKSFVEL
jgi:hypothetical protein